jgi:hypothetical protein
MQHSFDCYNGEGLARPRNSGYGGIGWVGWTWAINECEVQSSKKVSASGRLDFLDKQVLDP